MGDLGVKAFFWAGPRMVHSGSAAVRGCPSPCLTSSAVKEGGDPIEAAIEPKTSLEEINLPPPWAAVQCILVWNLLPTEPLAGDTGGPGRHRLPEGVLAGSCRAEWLAARRRAGGEGVALGDVMPCSRGTWWTAGSRGPGPGEGTNAGGLGPRTPGRRDVWVAAAACSTHGDVSRPAESAE